MHLACQCSLTSLERRNHWTSRGASTPCSRCKQTRTGEWRELLLERKWSRLEVTTPIKPLKGAVFWVECDLTGRRNTKHPHSRINSTPARHSATTTLACRQSQARGSLITKPRQRCKGRNKRVSHSSALTQYRVTHRICHLTRVGYPAQTEETLLVLNNTVWEQSAKPERTFFV